MSNAFLYRMPAGIPGNVTRIETATIEPQQLDPTNYPTSYGVPVAIDATTKLTRKIMAGDAAAAIYGLYPRPYPTSASQDGLGTSTPPTNGNCGVLKRGYMSVKLNVGTATKGGIVYVRVAANGGNTIIGGIEATSDSTNTIAMPVAYFMGPADANGNTEVAFNI
jgi:hypothetical protein